MQQGKIPTVIIIGAGPGGLSLYHALIKNKDKKEFNVKIFERESSPKDRWQGYHIGLNNDGIQSLFKCIPSSIASNLPKAMPNPIPDVEFHGATITDHTGNILLKTPTKQVKDVYEIAKNPEPLSVIISYRNELRDVLLEGAPVQWGKKCIGHEETKDGVWVSFADGSREFCDILVGADGINSPVRKQKVPELQIVDFGITQVNTDVAVPKHLMDKLIKINGNGLIQQILGLNGDIEVVAFRLNPEHSKEKNDSDELHYRASLTYMYPTNLDNIESEKTKVDDNDSASVIEHVKYMIRNLRPECEMTEILIELWDLAHKTTHPISRRKLQEINPLSINSWTSSRVTLLGDAIHAMSPLMGLGTNEAFQDADILSQALLNYSPENYISCIKEYENIMIKRASASVLKSRAITLKEILPVGHFGFIIRNSALKFVNILLKVQNFILNNIF